MYILGVLVGLGTLFLGAEWLVRGAARLASTLGVRPLVIGLTVVGFGTSAPELVVSALASLRDQPTVALGNAVGSCIANSGLILALAALLSPLRCDLALLKREGPLMVGVTIVFWLLAGTGVYTRWQGVLMLAGLAGFIYFSLRWARHEAPAVEAEFERYESEEKLISREPWHRQLVLLGFGLLLLVAGGHLLVTSAVQLAQKLEIPQIVIAATLVAVGTSLPELATSLVAALHREPDISVGNIVGSNIFNLLGVLGLGATLRPIPIAAEVRDFEMTWMLGFAAATALILRAGHRISRMEGGLLLTAYGVFLFLLFR